MVTAVEAMCLGSCRRIGPLQCKVMFWGHIDVELVDNSKKLMVVQVCHTYLCGLEADISDACVRNVGTPAGHEQSQG